jgi:hypothetical protein
VPALKRGYQGIAFDNLNLTNAHSRCGHYDQSGNWVNQFDGPGGLQRYQQAVLSWARYMRSKLHDAGRLMAINYSYSLAVPWHLNLALLSLPDLLFDEGGVTNWGNEGDNVASYEKWRLIFRAARQIQRHGVCYHLNGEEPQSTSSIPLAEREWIIANYLLVKARCTFVYITGYRADPSASEDSASQPVQDYGSYHNFPEYHLHIGAPLTAPEARDGLWKRIYTGGVVLVNPSDTDRGYRTRRSLYALGAPRPADRFSIPAHSALILLARPAQ